MDKILILDFGSQYTQLIARRIREFNVYCEIQPYKMGLEKIKAFKPKGLIMSGGPASVLSDVSHVVEKEVFDLNMPILGICYGMQLACHLLGGKVVKATHREYGKAPIEILDNTDLFKGFSKEDTVTTWMSHGDRIESLPADFISIAKTTNSPVAAAKHITKPLFTLQYHPEVVHTERGTDMLKNFVLSICKAKADWNMKSFVDHAVSEIQKKVGDQKVIMGVSGGVDSTVAAFLVHKAIGSQLVPIFINNGLLRMNEDKKVLDLFQNQNHMNLKCIDATDAFLSELKGVTDPEKKRKVIGRVFIEVFEGESKKIENATFLGQGTLYPDVIESVSVHGGPSATIKSHHNVGGLPKDMNLKLVEPLRELFKDEVRALGRELQIPDEFIDRQPFPGPGLAVRILGEITDSRLELLRAADDIVVTEIKKAGFYKKVWQSFAVLLPIKTVGVMGDERTYEHVIALRVVKSLDGMTADWVDLPHDLLGRISNRIINEVQGINRVVYDISSKPPSTIEWE